MGEPSQAILVTITFVRAAGRVLLIRRAPTKKTFPGLWNGLGGHVEPGEDVRAAALRELQEESGLLPKQITLRGVIHETGLQGRAHLLFLFCAEVDPEHVTKPLQNTREGSLCWFEIEKIPWNDCVPDLIEILPRLIEDDRMLFGTQHYDGTDRALHLKLEQHL